MHVLYADQVPAIRQPSIFLAGPTPRSRDVLSWRPRALDILRHQGFTGTVLVPERQDWAVRFSYLDQVEWEYTGLEAASVLAFWVPRDLLRLPGFTTNVEFGRYVGSARCIYGRPPDAQHIKYLDWLYRKLTGREPHDSLEATLRAAVELTQ